MLLSWCKIFLLSTLRHTATTLAIEIGSEGDPKVLRKKIKSRQGSGRKSSFLARGVSWTDFGRADCCAYGQEAEEPPQREVGAPEITTTSTSSTTTGIGLRGKKETDEPEVVATTVTTATTETSTTSAPSSSAAPPRTTTRRPCRPRVASTPAPAQHLPAAYNSLAATSHCVRDAKAEADIVTGNANFGNGKYDLGKDGAFKGRTILVMWYDDAEIRGQFEEEGDIRKALERKGFRVKMVRWFEPEGGRSTATTSSSFLDASQSQSLSSPELTMSQPDTAMWGDVMVGRVQKALKRMEKEAMKWLEDPEKTGLSQVWVISGSDFGACAFQKRKFACSGFVVNDKSMCHQDGPHKGLYKKHQARMTKKLVLKLRKYWQNGGNIAVWADNYPFVDPGAYLLQWLVAPDAAFHKNDQGWGCSADAQGLMAFVDGKPGMSYTGMHKLPAKPAAEAAKTGGVVENHPITTCLEKDVFEGVSTSGIKIKRGEKQVYGGTVTPLVFGAKEKVQRWTENLGEWSKPEHARSLPEGGGKSLEAVYVAAAVWEDGAGSRSVASGTGTSFIQQRKDPDDDDALPLCEAEDESGAGDATTAKKQPAQAGDEGKNAKKKRGRIFADGGSTRLMKKYYDQFPGTERFLVNVAAWLDQGGSAKEARRR